jgi:hypothetical protein
VSIYYRRLQSDRMVKLKITMKKDGREVAWFRDAQGRRVGTSMRASSAVGGMNWTQARQMQELGSYWVELQREQAAAGLGSDGAAMPALKQPKRKTRWSIKQKKVVEYGSWDTGYPAFKRRLGLKPVRDLYGPGGVVKGETPSGKKRYRKSGTEASRAAAGGKGHMLDDVRVTYVDDRQARIDISNSASRTKARANETRAPWWGLSPASVRKLTELAAQLFQMGITERLITLGLVAANQMGGSVSWFRKTMANARRVA